MVIVIHPLMLYSLRGWKKQVTLKSCRNLYLTQWKKNLYLRKARNEMERHRGRHPGKEKNLFPRRDKCPEYRTAAEKEERRVQFPDKEKLHLEERKRKREMED